MKSTNHVRRAPQSEILQSRGSQARGIAFGTEQDHLEVMIGRDRQPRAGSRVKPPLERVALDPQRAGNTALGRALTFGTNINEYRLCF